MDFLTTPLNDVALFRTKLDEFTRQYKEEVVLQQIPWDTYWQELVNVSVHGLGADVAEIGSTWVEPLVSMNALAPFSREEITSLSGEGSLSSAFWQNLRYSDKEVCWGIPSRIDMRMVFYWQDMFEAAGVDPHQAFSSHEAMTVAFERLQHSVPYPWGVITEKLSHNLVYNLAPWIWAEGGDFISNDGKKLLLDTAEARRGIRKHYELSRFMSPECRNATNEIALQLFAERKIAATIQGPWLIPALEQAGLTPLMRNLVGMVLPPGPPFMGGMVFVRWKHSRKIDLTGKLITALSERDFNAASAESSGMLPTHKGAWSDEFLRQNRYNPEYLKGLQNGRCLPSIRLWGMIEGRLAQMFRDIWDDLYALQAEARPEALDRIMAKHLDTLVSRFEMILGH